MAKKAKKAPAKRAAGGTKMPMKKGPMPPSGMMMRPEEMLMQAPAKKKAKKKGR